MSTQPIILHVEDTPEQLQLVRLLLAPVCILHQATTVHEASLLIEKNIFDLVLLDMQLPDGSGLELIAQIRARAPGTRIVLHTAGDNADLNATVDRVISKTDTPVKDLRDQLLAMLES